MLPNDIAPETPVEIGTTNKPTFGITDQVTDAVIAPKTTTVSTDLNIEVGVF